MIEKCTFPDQGKKNVVYSITEERIGSVDNIVDDKELQDIRCTTEYAVGHTEMKAQSEHWCDGFDGCDTTNVQTGIIPLDLAEYIYAKSFARKPFFRTCQ